MLSSLELKLGSSCAIKILGRLENLITKTFSSPIANFFGRSVVQCNPIFVQDKLNV